MKKILIIDDEEAVRKSFVLALEDDYEVSTADCGEQGVEFASKNNFDLVFTDLKMPGINGVEALSQIREMGQTMPIYIVTAFHKEFFDDLAIARQKGYPFQLARKPLGLDDILEIANAVLGQGE